MALPILNWRLKITGVLFVVPQSNQKSVRVSLQRTFLQHSTLFTPLSSPLLVAKIASRRGSIDPNRAAAPPDDSARTHRSASGVGFSMISHDPHTSLRGIFHTPEVVRAGAPGCCCCCCYCSVIHCISQAIACTSHCSAPSRSARTDKYRAPQSGKRAFSSPKSAPHWHTALSPRTSSSCVGRPLLQCSTSKQRRQL